MAKQTDNLSHHERLRLDYLYKNIHYLNEREKKEYEYLLRKERGERPTTPQSNHRRNQVANETTPEHFGFTEQGLPKYPEGAKRSVGQKRKTTVATINEGIAPNPMPKKRQARKISIKKIFIGFVLFLLMVILGMVFMFIKGLTNPGVDNTKAAETEVFHGQDTRDGINILILGTDGRIGQTSSETRTDSIMVLNVGGSDGRMKLVSFMRDTLVHIEGVSADSAYGLAYDQKLNVAYAIGEQNQHQGAELVRETLKENFDLDIKYYALVDFATFATAIDTLFPSGVEMNATFSTVDGQAVSEIQVPDDLNMKDGIVPEQTIRVGQQRMDGRTLLNYARFRKDDEGDFGRTRRQQEVMSAVMNQIKDPTKLFTGSEALGKVFALTSTNIPYSFLLTNGLTVVANAGKGIDKITVPENGDWVDDYDAYGGQALFVDFESYKGKLAQLGLR